MVTPVVMWTLPVLILVVGIGGMWVADRRDSRIDTISNLEYDLNRQVHQVDKYYAALVHIRKLAWDHRDIAPELSVIITDEIDKELTK